jgi:hypothetical protein
MTINNSINQILGAATATSINFGGSTLNNFTSITAWTPVFTFATPGNLSVSYVEQTGWYSRIGNIVTANFVLGFTPTFTTSSGNAEITGIPFSSNSDTLNSSFGASFTSSITFPTGCTSICSALFANTSAILLMGSGSAVTNALFTSTQFVSGTAVLIQGSMVYQV